MGDRAASEWTATITVTVSVPGGPNASDAFVLTVTAVNDAPTAPARSYTAHTNMRISIPAASGLLGGAADANDVAGNPDWTPAFTVGTVNGVAPTGGTITVTIPNRGTVTTTAGGPQAGAFDFDPAPGVTGAVGFTYTVCDSGEGPPATACSAPATVTFTVSGPVIWFVDPAAPGPGDGRLGSPFRFLSGNPGAANDAADVDAAGHRVFVYAGTATSGIALNTGGWLIGQGVSPPAPGAGFDDLFGISPPAGTLARPAIGGGTATVRGTVTLNTGAVVKGLAIAAGASPGLNDPAAAISGVTVEQVAVTTTTGTAVTLSDAGGALSLTSVSASGAANGIVLRNTTGSFAVTGDGDTSVGGNGSGGTIQNTTGDGVLLANARNVSFTNVGIQGAGGRGVAGTGVVDFAFTHSTVDSSGTGLGAEAANLGFNTTSAGTENNLSGSVTITGNVLTHASYHGVDIHNFSGTISDAVISRNTITSTTSTATSKGTGIRLAGSGSATTVASISRATIDQNTVTNFPSAAGIMVQGGNATSPAAPAGVYGAGAASSHRHHRQRRLGAERGEPDRDPGPDRGRRRPGGRVLRRQRHAGAERHDRRRDSGRAEHHQPDGRQRDSRLRARRQRPDQRDDQGQRRRRAAHRGAPGHPRRRRQQPQRRRRRVPGHRGEHQRRERRQPGHRPAQAGHGRDDQRLRDRGVGGDVVPGHRGLRRRPEPGRRGRALDLGHERLHELLVGAVGPAAAQQALELHPAGEVAVSRLPGATTRSAMKRRREGRPSGGAPSSTRWRSPRGRWSPASPAVPAARRRRAVRRGAAGPASPASPAAAPRPRLATRPALAAPGRWP